MTCDMDMEKCLGQITASTEACGRYETDKIQEDSRV